MQKSIKIILLFLICMANNKLLAQTKKETKSILKIMYFNEMMGNVHQNSSRYSQTLTTISCNHPVKVIRTQSGDKENLYYGNGEWVQIQVGPYEGYILKDLLSDRKQECFQDQYPKFFDEMKMSLTDLYYLGRLNDQYLTGKSKAPEGSLIPNEGEGVK